jgi:hypothetical protein
VTSPSPSPATKPTTLQLFDAWVETQKGNKSFYERLTSSSPVAAIILNHAEKCALVLQSIPKLKTNPVKEFSKGKGTTAKDMCSHFERKG